MKEKINTAFRRMDEYHNAIWDIAYHLKREIETEQKNNLEKTNDMYKIFRSLESIMEATYIIETLIDINREPF